MRILPVTALAVCAKVVQDTILIEVVVKEELAGRRRLLAMHGGHDVLRGTRCPRWATALRRSKSHVLLTLNQSIVTGKSSHGSAMEALGHAVSRLEAKLTLVCLLESLIDLTTVQILIGFLIAAVWAWNASTAVRAHWTLATAHSFLHFVSTAGSIERASCPCGCHAIEDVATNVLSAVRGHRLLRWIDSTW